MAGSILDQGAGSSLLNRSPSFPRFLEIRCQASAAAGLEKPPPSGDRWLRPVTRIVCCQVGARRPLRCEQPSSTSTVSLSTVRRGGLSTSTTKSDARARTKRSPRTRIFVTSISDALELLAEIFRPLTLLVPVLDFPGPRIRNRL
jgi:hypothetical protein